MAQEAGPGRDAVALMVLLPDGQGAVVEGVVLDAADSPLVQ